MYVASTVMRGASSCAIATDETRGARRPAVLRYWQSPHSLACTRGHAAVRCSSTCPFGDRRASSPARRASAQAAVDSESTSSRASTRRATRERQDFRTLYATSSVGTLATAWGEPASANSNERHAMTMTSPELKRRDAVEQALTTAPASNDGLV